MIAKFKEELSLCSLSSLDETWQGDLLVQIAKINEGVSDTNSQTWENNENKTVHKLTMVGVRQLCIPWTLAISAMTLQKDDLLRHFRIVCRTHDDTDIFSLLNMQINKEVSVFAYSKVLLLIFSFMDISQSYLPEVQINMDLFRALVPALLHFSQHSVLLIAYQPVEIIT